MPSARSATSSTRERLRELENLLVAQEAAEQRVANAIPRKPLKALYTRMKQIDRKRWVQPVSAPPALPHRSHNTIAIPTNGSTSTIPVPMFQKMLKAQGAELSNDDLQSLLDTYGRSNNTIDYVDLMRKVQSHS